MTARPEPAPDGRELVRLVAPNAGPMTLAGTNTYVVGCDPAHVVDPGPDDPAHLEAVRAEGAARGGIAGVLLTHSHADHSAGVEALGAPLIWGEVSDVDEASGFGGGAALARNPGIGQAESTVGPFTVIPTPGHAPDHVAFSWGDVCFCGDLVLGEGSSIVPPAAFGGSLADYMRSLERLGALGADLLAPGHGTWITDPSAKLDEYVSHRTERERRLLAVLEAGERSRSALLDAVWDDVPEILRPAAAMAMQAHLEKLEAEGQVREAELGP